MNTPRFYLAPYVLFAARAVSLGWYGLFVTGTDVDYVAQMQLV